MQTYIREREREILLPIRPGFHSELTPTSGNKGLKTPLIHGKQRGYSPNQEWPEKYY